MAEKIASILCLDSVIIIPTNVAPHKSLIPIQLIGKEHRYEMCRLACEDNNLFKLSDIEIKKEGKSYTVDTLREISKNNKNCKLYLIMGSDSFLSISNWFGIEEIINLVTICAVIRDPKENARINKMDQILKNKGAKIILFYIPIVNVSSTMIRNRIGKGIDVTGLIPDKVYDYIKHNTLYSKMDCENTEMEIQK
jgi:nicotinate-nucleotide adenylyltransferase